jgi:methylphosphotriester-DNA--protein-cysteine methyltransferase
MAASFLGIRDRQHSSVLLPEFHLGYEYDASFFQTFKRVMGICPSEFKKAASAEHSSANTALP